MEWLGEVPSTWSAKRLKHLVAERDGIQMGPFGGALLELVSEDTGFKVYGQENTISGDFHAGNRWLPPDRFDALANYQLRDGDLVLTRKGSLGSARLVESLPQPGIMDSDTIRIRVDERAIRGTFLARLLHEAAYALEQITRQKRGAILSGINSQTVANLWLAVPPLQEQMEIEAFLTREAGRLDALMAEQQRLIELLKEKRQAVISHAVTKGLNPDAPMKSSGVEWLGDVPAHWQVLRIAALLREVVDAGVDDLPILSVSIHDGVSDRELSEDDLERKVVRSEDRSTYKRAQSGDLVYNMMRAWQGAFGTVRTEGLVSPAYVVARPVGDLPAAFLEYVLRTPQAITEMRGRSRGVTDFRLRLYWEEFKDMRVPVPPAEELQGILRTIAGIDAEVASLTAEAERAITLLQERRTAVISAAVTGKICVCDLVVHHQV